MNTSTIIENVLIPLVAAFFGAILAFRYQRVLELKRDKRSIIQVLMMYRNVGAHELDWIKALNTVDIAFNKDKKVREIYHTLLTQLRPPLFQNSQWVETYFQLIAEMARCSDYKDLNLHEIRDYYNPIVLDQHYPNMNTAAGPLPPATEDLQPSQKR